MSRGKYKKLYYVPGLISLVLLPLILASWGSQMSKKLNTASLEVNLYSPSPLDSVLRSFHHFDRNYEKVILGANTKENKVKLAYAEQRLIRMIEANDSTTGIHISFSNVKYKTYVDGLSILYGVDNVVKLVGKDGIRYYNRWRSKDNFMVCGGVIFVDPPLPEPSFLDKLKSFPNTIIRKAALLSDTFKALWLAISAFSALMALSLMRSYKAFKTST